MNKKNKKKSISEQKEDNEIKEAASIKLKKCLKQMYEDIIEGK